MSVPGRMPGAGLRREVQERAGGARDCGEMKAQRGDGPVTVVQKNSAPALIASDKPSGVVGRTKWHAWFKQKGQSFDIIPSRSPELGERNPAGFCIPAAVQILGFYDAACCCDEARVCETPGASAASRIEKIAIQVMTLPGCWAGFNLGAADGSMRLHAAGANRAIDRHTGRRRRRPGDSQAAHRQFASIAVEGGQHGRQRLRNQDCAGRVHRQFCFGGARVHGAMALGGTNGIL